ncbi:MAG TPA: CoA pyrophosphatase [Pirellulales bacterium]|nr:CoA pyrophosphatase [Pirellulales bacterium]
MRLAQPLPGVEAQRCFAPDLSYGRHFGPPPGNARSAAVVVLLYRRDGRWHLPLTVRPTTMLDHAGQISLPGGKIETGESSFDAALRELAEELAVAPVMVSRLGTLTPLYLYNSNFMVAPWVVGASEPLVFQPNPGEVAELIELPLSAIVDRSLRGTHRHRSRGVEVVVPHLAWQGHYIWGATSMILGELAAICDDLAE